VLFIRRAAYGFPFVFGNLGLKDEVCAEVDTPNLVCIGEVAFVDSISGGIEDILTGGGEDVFAQTGEPGHGQGGPCEKSKN